MSKSPDNFGKRFVNHAVESLVVVELAGNGAFLVGYGLEAVFSQDPMIFQRALETIGQFQTEYWWVFPVAAIGLGVIGAAVDGTKTKK